MKRDYKVTGLDVYKLENMGYVLDSKDGKTLDVFINTLFPKFNILRLLLAVEKNFSKTTKEKISRNIAFDFKKKQLLIDFNNNTGVEDDALFFVRLFSKSRRSILVDHRYCVLPKLSRGQGLIKPVFKESLQQYINCNVSKILVHAALSGGGYTWAKYGFRAVNKGEMRLILFRAKSSLSVKEFAICEKIYNGYYNKYPTGKSFPINLWGALDFMKPLLMGSSWHGELNLKKNRDLNKFKEYVYR